MNNTMMTRHFLTPIPGWPGAPADWKLPGNGISSSRCSLPWRAAGYWIWAAAMAGTANTPWNRAPAEALGLDLSEKMIAEARARNADPRIRYEVCGIAEYSYPAGYYDLVVSNLALHYLADLDDIYRKVFSTPPARRCIPVQYRTPGLYCRCTGGLGPGR